MLFFEQHPESYPLYEAFYEKLMSLFPDARAKVQKSQISFYNRHLFACVSFLRVKKKADLPERYFVLTLGLPEPLDSDRVAAKTEPYPGRWTTHFVISETADLDEQENDAFAEKRPVHRRTDRDQTGDAGRARRGEQRIDKGRCAAALCGAGQHEQQRSCQNNERETNSDHHRRVHRAALRRSPSNACHNRIPPCLSYI